MSVNYREMKDTLKLTGDIPEWYSTNALQFFMDSYSYNKEGVKQRYQMIAKTLAKFAPDVFPTWWVGNEYTKGLSYEEGFFKALWDGYAIPSSPVMSNTGLPERGLTVSCCGQHMSNSIAGKAFSRGELEVLIKNSHGCSMSVTDWLAEGDAYGDDDNISAGVIPVIDDMQNSTEDTNQSKRRGQTVFSLDVLHGDFWRVVRKLDAERAFLNISWLMTDRFISLLENGDEEAISRWNEICYVKQKTGKGYFTKIDTMNRNKAEVFKALGLDVKGSNLCVAPETLLLTKEGYFPIVALVGQPVEVWNGKEWSETEVVKTGENQKLLSVLTSSNQNIEATEYHKWYVQEGYTGGSVVVKRTHELRSGDKLVKFDTPVVHGDLTLDDAYTNGFYTGDGCFSGGIQRTYLYHNKKNILEKLTSVRNVYNDAGCDRIIVTHDGSLKDKFFVPLTGYTVKSRLEWLAGLCDSDGVVARNGTNESIQIASTELEFLREVQLMLQTLGVQSKIQDFVESGYRDLPKNDGSGEKGSFLCKKAWRLLISSSGLFKLSQLGFVTYRLVWTEKLPQRNAEQFVTIKEVVDNGRVSDTYCVTEPKEHKAVFNGVLTGNCNEVNLPANHEYSFTCVIMNINLTLYDTMPSNMFKIIHLMQDCNVSNYIQDIEKKTGDNAVFLSKVLKFTKDFRAVGTGVAGLHSLFMQRGYVFGGFDSMLLNEEIFKRMRKDTREVSQWLGDVLGVPEGIKKAGFTYRNATTMMMPPTKSSSETARNSPTEGINPETALVKVKESVAGELYRINTALLKIMKERGVYNTQTINDIHHHKGSVQHVTWLTEDEKPVFRTAFEIPMEDHLSLCSQRQVYIDQQQSINLFFSGSDSEEYIAKVQKIALLDEMCNGTYYNYSSRGGVFVRPESCAICQ